MYSSYPYTYVSLTETILTLHSRMLYVLSSKFVQIVPYVLHKLSYSFTKHFDCHVQILHQLDATKYVFFCHKVLLRDFLRNNSCRLRHLQTLQLLSHQAKKNSFRVTQIYSHLIHNFIVAQDLKCFILL